MGSWNTMPTRAPRTARSSACRQPGQVAAFEQDLPGGHPRQRRRKRFISAKAVIDLPEPDSPTRPTASPRRTVTDRSLTTRSGVRPCA